MPCRAPQLPWHRGSAQRRQTRLSRACARASRPSSPSCTRTPSQRAAPPRWPASQSTRPKKPTGRLRLLPASTCWRALAHAQPPLRHQTHASLERHQTRSPPPHPPPRPPTQTDCARRPHRLPVAPQPARRAPRPGASKAPRRALSLPPARPKRAPRLARGQWPSGQASYRPPTPAQREARAMKPVARGRTHKLLRPVSLLPRPLCAPSSVLSMSFSNSSLARVRPPDSQEGNTHVGVVY